MSEDYLAQQQPTLKWNPARSVWEMIGTESLLCEHLEPFLQTWPTSGLMRNGQVFELRMQEHRITDSESSSLPTLPTTRAQHGEDRNNKIYARDLQQPQNLENALHAVLPTPTTRDYKDGTAEHERDGVVQTDTVARAVFNSGEVLLPTPTAVDGNTVAKSELDANDPKHRLKVAAQVIARDDINWGKFEPAIRRWEQAIGRPAPAPTKPDGKDGNHRLSSRFTEWMMGLPDGWITDVGLKRNDELKACGNGVVPQQAVLALRVLLDGIQIERGGGK